MHPYLFFFLRWSNIVKCLVYVGCCSVCCGYRDKQYGLWAHISRIFIILELRVKAPWFDSTVTIVF